MNHMDSSISKGTAVCLALVVGCAILAGATGVAVASTPIDQSLEESTAETFTIINESTDEVADDTTVDGTTDTDTTDDDTTDTVNETSSDTSDSVDGTDETLDDSTENTTDSIGETDDTTGGTVDAVDESGTVDETVDTTGTVDETADTINNTTDSVDETTDTVRNTTNDTTDGLEETVDETTDEIDDATNETTGSLLEEPIDSTTDALEATAGGIEDGISEAVSTASSGQIPGTDALLSTVSDGESALGAISGGEPTDPGTAQTATDAMLVGLLGAVTVSAGAAGGIGGAGGVVGGAVGGTGAAGIAGTTAGAGIAGGAAGAGAAGGAGAASGGGLTGTASNAVANWSATGRRSLRRALAAIPWELIPILKYSRYDDSDPLENETRNAIYETLEADPGRYLSQISDEIDIPLSTVRHHVRILEEEDLLTTAKINGKRRYYLEEIDSELQAALEEPAKRDVLEALATLERANNSELAAELERDPSTVTHHLSTLEDDGLVVREREGRSIVNELAAEASAALFEDENTTLEDPSPQAPAD